VIERAKDRPKTRNHFADEHCSHAVRHLLSITDVGQRVGPDGAEENAMSEGSEWEI